MLLVAVFHRYVLPSLPPAARRPSGPDASAYTAWPLWLLGSLRVAIRLWVEVFHRKVLPLSSPTARVPPGPNATASTRPSWPAARWVMRLPVAVLNSCVVTCVMSLL